jgi:aryl-alcohol dehydrogenase-like predicted oxidoreductase
LVNAGLNFIDTADVYSVWVPGHRGGESETVIGNWLKRRNRRDDVVIATKVGMQMAADRKGLSAAHIMRSIDESLQRLQTDHVDLYFSHSDDATVSKGVVEKFLNERGLKILAALDEVGRRRRASPASVALAWQIARPSITAPIASATTVEQLNELVAATRLHLDTADIDQLNAASA